MRTQKEIETEILALEACKDYIPHYTLFGDDNWRKVSLQIEYLRGDIDTTTDEFNEEFSNDEQSAVLEAQDWEEGNCDESPSSGWDNYKPKVQAGPKPVTAKPAKKKAKQ